jgi:molybdate transport system substrate-binding protein
MLAAAASLRGVVPELIADFHATHPGPVPIVSYGASGTLCSQVEAGAPVHAVLFAAQDPVDRLVAAGLADPASVVGLAGNQLVLVGNAESPDLDLRSLGALGPDQRLVVGNPDFVPAGRYARALLDELGLWQRLGARLVYAGDVTRALAYVRRGEADLALVYATDAIGQQGVRVLDRADWHSAPRPNVVAALTPLGTAHPSAGAFFDYVRSDAAAATFAGFGFSAPWE